MSNDEWDRMTNPVPIPISEIEWLTATDPKRLLTFLKTNATGRKLRLFACGSARDHWDDLIDQRSRRAIEMSEMYADGKVSGSTVDVSVKMAHEAYSSFTKDLGRDHPHAVAAQAALFAAGHACSQLHPYLHPQFFDPNPQRRCVLLRELFGNPFRPVTLDPRWQSETVVALANGIYTDRAFDRMPILADALEEAGCDHADILTHCRGLGPHVRGCWVVDLVLGRS